MKKFISCACCLAICGVMIGCSLIGPASVENQGAQLHQLGPSSVEDQRAKLHEQMLRGEMHHDGALQLHEIGDMTSVPALMMVLKENPPKGNGVMICTTAHALTALRKITGANPGITYEAWNTWWTEQNPPQ